MNKTSTIPQTGPRKSYRWLVLVVASMAMFGNYYVYDSLAPISDLLVSQLGFSESEYGLLQSLYNIVNILMVPLGGILIDRIGTKKAALIFSTLCMVGTGITAVEGSFMTLAIGRMIFGIGAESLIVAVTTVLAKWFKGKELAFAFGINLTIARLGSLLADNSPTLFGSVFGNWRGPILVALSFAVISVIAVLIYVALERSAEKKYSLAGAGEPDKIVWKEIFSFGIPFWIIVALCMTFYSAVFPFRSFAYLIFMDKHDITRELAGNYNSIIIFASMILTPIFGLIADKYGRRATLMIAGSVLIIPVFLLVGYTKLELWLPMAMMGISFLALLRSRIRSVAAMPSSTGMFTSISTTSKSPSIVR